MVLILRVIILYGVLYFVKLVSGVKKKKPLPLYWNGRGKIKWSAYLLSNAVASTVPSTTRGLTSVFGMGTGVSPTALTLQKYNDR